MEYTVSKKLFVEARKYIPGGVNSPVRACKSVGCDPVFITKARGASVFDADGNEYVDFVCSWGPMIMGHAHPDIIEALHNNISLDVTKNENGFVTDVQIKSPFMNKELLQKAWESVWEMNNYVSETIKEDPKNLTLNADDIIQIRRDRLQKYIEEVI